MGPDNFDSTDCTFLVNGTGCASQFSLDKFAKLARIGFECVHVNP